VTLSRPIRRAHAGFTLFELILSTATAAMLALALYASLHAAMKARGSAHDATASLRQAVIAADLVRRDLVSIPPPTGILAGPLEGQPGITSMTPDGGVARFDSIRFFTFDEDAGTDGLVWVEYAVRQEDGRGILIRSVERNLLAPVQREPLQQVICIGVESFTIEYLDGSVWTPAWEPDLEAPTLPAAVRVTLRASDPSTPSARPASVTRVVPIPTANATVVAVDPEAEEDEADAEVDP
jgi:hypothetical protein